MGAWSLLLVGLCSLPIPERSNPARFLGLRFDVRVSPGVPHSGPTDARLAKEVVAGWSRPANPGDGRTCSERLVVRGPDGTVLARAEGDEHRVQIDPTLDRLLQTPGAHTTLTHTHLAGTGPSGADLGQLAKPGVEAIEVEGADGSRYRAAAGPRYDAAHFEDVQFPTARREIERQLRSELHQTPRADVDAHFSHLVATSLDKAGIIRYRAALSATRAETYRLNRIAFGRATEAAAAAVKRLPENAERMHP